MNLAHLDLPFFSREHKALGFRLEALVTENLEAAIKAAGRGALDIAGREFVRRLRAAGWLRLCVGEDVRLHSRRIGLAREVPAGHGALANFAFAMQGMASAIVSLAGTSQHRARYLSSVSDGSAIAAFALSEPGVASDVGALQCTNVPSVSGYELNGDRTWTSNEGVANFYVIFTRLPERCGSVEVCAFIVRTDTPRLEIAERHDTILPHPLTRLRLTACRVLERQRVGAEEQGFKLALRALDIFRIFVGAAAVGFARHSLALSLERAAKRPIYGTNLGVLAAHPSEARGHRDQRRRGRAARLPRCMAARSGFTSKKHEAVMATKEEA